MEATATVPIAPAPERRRRWLPLFALLAILVVVAFGGYVTAAALSVPTGPPVDVAGVVRVSPLSGWEVIGRGANPPGVRLTRGSGNLDVFVFGPAGGDATGLLRAFVSRVLEPDARQLSVSPRTESVVLRSGSSGVRVSYVGQFGKGATPIEGEVTAVVSPSGAGVVFDGWSPEGLLDFVLGDIDAMVDSAEVR